MTSEVNRHQMTLSLVCTQGVISCSSAPGDIASRMALSVKSNSLLGSNVGCAQTATPPSVSVVQVAVVPAPFPVCSMYLISTNCTCLQRSCRAHRDGKHAGPTADG